MIAPTPSAPLISNEYYCIGKDISSITPLAGMCEPCVDGAGNPLATQTTWWDAPTGGNQVGTGDSFDPIASGIIDPNVIGCYTFYAQCECSICLLYTSDAADE